VRWRLLWVPCSAQYITLVVTQHKHKIARHVSANHSPSPCPCRLRLTHLPTTIPTLHLTLSPPYLSLLLLPCQVALDEAGNVIGCIDIRLPQSVTGVAPSGVPAGDTGGCGVQCGVFNWAVGHGLCPHGVCRICRVALAVCPSLHDRWICACPGHCVFPHVAPLGAPLPPHTLCLPWLSIPHPHTPPGIASRVVSPSCSRPIHPSHPFSPSPPLPPPLTPQAAPTCTTLWWRRRRGGAGWARHSWPQA
jgi:hypothetical protein